MKYNVISVNNLLGYVLLCVVLLCCQWPVEEVRDFHGLWVKPNPPRSARTCTGVLFLI